jgi:hypothetical protein
LKSAVYTHIWGTILKCQKPLHSIKTVRVFTRYRRCLIVSIPLLSIEYEGVGYTVGKPKQRGKNGKKSPYPAAS